MAEDKILQGLNDRQKEAVTTTEGYVRVIAGAGSGKTKALTHRYAYIVSSLGVSPSNILCVTFTNKAANEMKKRVQKLTGSGAVNDLICTYHSFCGKVLREDISKVMYPSSFHIMDEADQKVILRDVYKELSINSRDLTFKDAISIIDGYKTLAREAYVEEYIVPTKEIAIDPTWRLDFQIIASYIKHQKKGHYLDFNDLISFALYIFNSNPDVLEKWQNRLHYIMVDETQDNSFTQWRLVSMLQEKHKNLFVVGDPDQAIYGWRGAKPDGLVAFNKDFTPCHTVIMDENYRSTEDILKVANCIIANNHNRIEKDLFTKRGGGLKVVHFHAKKEEEEAAWIAQTIQQKVDGGSSLKDIAILYRANYLSKSIEDALVRASIPYIIYGGIRFFERKEIKDALSYLRLLASDDNLSFLRLINKPSRKLGKVFIDKLVERAESEKQSYYATLKAHIEDKIFNKPGANQFIGLIDGLREEMKSISISDLLRVVLDRSGLMEIYRTDGDNERLENITELINSVMLYEEDNVNEEDISLHKYLQDIALYTDFDHKKEDTAFVKLMNIHQAKGLEFPHVFICGLSDGILPSYRAIRDRKQEALEEERRIMYVAVTRAERELFLTETEGFRHEIGGMRYPSRFIFEIKDEFFVTEGVLSDELKNLAKENIKIMDEQLLYTPPVYEVGALVIHPVFGNGEVIEITSESGDYIIKFDKTETPRPIRMDFKGLQKQVIEEEYKEMSREEILASFTQFFPKSTS